MGNPSVLGFEWVFAGKQLALHSSRFMACIHLGPFWSIQKPEPDGRGLDQAGTLIDCPGLSGSARSRPHEPLI